MSPFKKMVEKARKLLWDKSVASRYRSLIKIVQNEDLAILNYTDHCQRRRAWDELTLFCRGLILHAQTGELIAYPFPKFFNWEELSISLPKEPFTVWEKMDGSLGILYRQAGEFAIATRGSFTSREARRGTELFSQFSNRNKIPEDLTLLFEVIVQDGGSNLVKYDYEGLVLLGGYSRSTGKELSSSEIRKWADTLSCKKPRIYSFDSFEHVLSQQKTLPANAEGFVVRFKNGLRVKVKGDAYLAAHKMALGFSRGKILGLLSQGNNSYQSFFDQMPEEFRPDATRIANEFRETAKQLEIEAKTLFEKKPNSKERKDFAKWVATHPAHLKGILFQLWDNKSLNWYEFLPKEQI